MKSKHRIKTGPDNNEIQTENEKVMKIMDAFTWRHKSESVMFKLESNKKLGFQAGPPLSLCSGLSPAQTRRQLCEHTAGMI